MSAEAEYEVDEMAPVPSGGVKSMHLILIGLPGAGKTTLGRAVAEELGKRFVDMDEEIERREGRAISDIFAADGEDYFRRCERNLTSELSNGEGTVLAPGGGWACDPVNVSKLRPPGRMVYLRVSPEAALSRMGEAVSRRPLLDRPDPLEALQQLYMARDRFYMEADLYVDTEDIDLSALTALVCEYARLVEVA